MNNDVMIVNSDKQLKAVIVCDKLMGAGIAFRFEMVGAQYCVHVARADVRQAIDVQSIYMAKHLESELVDKLVEAYWAEPAAELAKEVK